MSKFFPYPSQQLVDQAQAVSAYFVNDNQVKTKFNLNDALHTNLILSSAQSVTEKLAELQHIDKQIALGYATGVSAFVLSYLLPFSTIAIAGFTYGAYYMGRRQQAYVEYNFALQNLIRCCIWALGETKNANLKNCKAITEMMNVLDPLVDEKTLRDCIDNSVENELVQNKKESIQAFGQHLKREQADLYFKMYGYKQGGFIAIFEAVSYAILTAFAACKNMISDKVAEEVPAGALAARA